VMLNFAEFEGSSMKVIGTHSEGFYLPAQ